MHNVHGKLADTVSTRVTRNLFYQLKNDGIVVQYLPKVVASGSLDVPGVSRTLRFKEEFVLFGVQLEV
jgi:hypothetical protein